MRTKKFLAAAVAVASLASVLTGIGYVYVFGTTKSAALVFDAQAKPRLSQGEALRPRTASEVAVTFSKESKSVGCAVCHEDPILLSSRLRSYSSIHAFLLNLAKAKSVDASGVDGEVHSGISARDSANMFRLAKAAR